MVGVAVKATLVPEQMVCAPAVIAILTLAGKLGLTVIVTEFEVAGEPEAQLAVEVITTDTTSLLAKVLLLYVALLVPTLLPFNFHW